MASRHVIYPAGKCPAIIAEHVAEHGWNGRRTQEGSWEEANCLLRRSEVDALKAAGYAVLTRAEMAAEIGESKLVPGDRWEPDTTQSTASAPRKDGSDGR